METEQQEPRSDTPPAKSAGPSVASRLAMAAILTSFSMCGVSAVMDRSDFRMDSPLIYLIGAPLIGAGVGWWVLEEGNRFRMLWLAFTAFVGLLVGARFRLGVSPTPWAPKLTDYLPLAATIFVAVLLGTFLTRSPGLSPRVRKSFVTRAMIWGLVAFLTLLALATLVHAAQAPPAPQ